MPQCNTCMADIDADDDAHVQVVKPMDYKGKRQKVTQFYCSVGCLNERAD